MRHHSRHSCHLLLYVCIFCLFGDFYTSCHCGFLFESIYCSCLVELKCLHNVFNFFYITDETMLMLVQVHSYLIHIYNEICSFCFICLRHLFFYFYCMLVLPFLCMCAFFVNDLLETKDFCIIFKLLQTDRSHSFGCILS
uniref:Uncharacterized protein n=1 Tax=Rhipicephalus pulchellus TaxID=72859 RepID=L7LYM3_RHIPC